MSQMRVVIELDENVAAGLEAAAREARLSVEDFAAKAVARAVTDLELWAEEEGAFAEYERTGEALPLATIEEWVRSWGTPNELPPSTPCKLPS